MPLTFWKISKLRYKERSIWLSLVLVCFRLFTSFISDADKANNDIYYEKLIEMVRPGGLIIVDNTLWYGQVADEKVMEEFVSDLEFVQVVNKVTQKIRDFNDKAFNDPRIDFALIPAADGMAACRVL